jgi:3-deoxy-D-manno-octulosonic-acid transferase
VDPLAIFHGVYQVLGGIAAAPAMFLSSLSGRGGGYWLDRLGSPAAGGGRPYWLHAASVGEAGSAASVIRAWRDLEPEARFVLSVGTPAGRAFAENALSDLGCVQFMAPPLDVWGAPGRTIARVDPRALVIIETEIWPGLIRACRKRRVPVILAAGRISERTARRYGWVRSFFGQLLNFMEKLFVISEADRERFLGLGVDPARIEVMGSPKFDPLIALARGPAPLPIAAGPPYLLVAGSTHPGEEELITSELLKTLLSRALHNNKKPLTPESYSAETCPAVLEAWREVGTEAYAVKEVLGQTGGRTAMGLPDSGAPDAAAPDGEEPGPAAGEPGGAAAAGRDGADPEAPAPGSGEPAGDGAAGSGPETVKDADGGGASAPGAPSPEECPGPEPREMGTGGLQPGNPFKLIIVPRHVNRAKEVLELARGKGFRTGIISDPEIPFPDLPEVGVFSAVGHLQRLYERCDLAIVCGSFAPGLQGHNPLEPSAAARPMIFGPNMTSFHEQARALMERAACIMVVRNDIHTVLSEYAKDPHIARISGQRGRDYVAGLTPVAPKLARAIAKALGAEPAEAPAPGTGGTGGSADPAGPARGESR